MEFRINKQVKNKIIKICHLTTVHSPFDVRIFHKECKNLKQEGFQVSIIAQYDKKETRDGIKIVPLPKISNRFKRVTLLPYMTLIKAVKEKANIYHFHDPELIPIGIVLKLLNKKVIYDVHEDVPKQILTKDYWFKSLFVRKLVAKIAHLVEQFGAFIFDGIITATPEIAKKFNQKKTVTIKNLPIISLINKAQPIKTDKKKPIVIYVGGLSRIRGIKEIIQAMKFIEGKADLWLLGKWESEKFKKECENLEGWNYTKYLGFKPLKEVYSFIKVADIGLSVLHPLQNYLTSLPIKAFEYMACSLPMIMSNFSYWKRIFGGCALFVDPYNPKDIAKKILALLKDKELRIKLGKVGQNLVINQYSWESESKKLLSFYKKLV